MQSSSPDSLIAAGDLLDIGIFGANDYSQEVRVSEQGQIILPLIGMMRVGGLTIAQAEEEVAEKLAGAGLYNDPQVSIFQKESAAQGIAVMGEVQRPGIYHLSANRTLFQAISAAGGTTQTAGRTAVITHREQPNHPETVPLAYDGEHFSESNVRIQPGDTIVVARAGVVYVVGEVTRPTGIVMQSPSLSVLQAVAMAEGTKSTAALDKAKLIRKTPGGQQEIPLSMKKILAAKAPDEQLQAGDIVFVPSSVAKTAGKRTLDAIVQAAVGIAVYSRY
jgi:polysaccharide export outer membrane protein